VKSRGALRIATPQAIRADKRLLNASFDASAAELLQGESLEQDRLMGSPNQVEAARAGLEGRTCVFKEDTGA